MGVSRAFKAVIPRTFKDDAARFIMLRELQKQADTAIELFKITTETWNHQPEFTRSLSSRYGEEPSITIETDDEIYSYLNYGTAVRTVAVSEDWQSKTEPGRFRPTAGAGSIVGGGIFPGISARNFDEMVADRFEATFEEAMIDAMIKAAQASGHGG